MQKKVKLIAGAIALILIISAVFMINKSAGNENLQTAEINTSIPFNQGITTDSKVEAYEKEIKDNNDKSKEEIDLTNVNLKGLGKKELTPEEKVDSVLNANKITYNEPIINKNENNYNKRKKKKYSSSNNNSNYSTDYSNSNTVIKENEQVNYSSNNTKNLNNFFKSNPKGNDNNTSLKYDKIIYASVYGDKNTPNGGRVSLRLSKDALINGIKYPRNTLMYSFAKFGQNRVYLHVSKINQNSVSLDVYDSQDGSKGIYTEKNLVQIQASETTNDLKLKGVPVERLGKEILKKAKSNKVMIFNNYKLLLKKSK